MFLLEITKNECIGVGVSFNVHIILETNTLIVILNSLYLIRIKDILPVSDFVHDSVELLSRVITYFIQKRTGIA